MYDYFIHSDNGFDGPELVGGADTLADARAIAQREQARDPQRFVTIIDRLDVEHKIEGV